MRQIPEPYRETPQWKLPSGDLPPTLGPVFTAWAETMLVHGEGDLLGSPYRVPLWLRRAAYRILEFNPAVVDSITGAHPFIVREVLIVCPKGSAKTEGMAALALFLLAGPSMPTPDGPVMRVSPNIPVAAGSWDQANKLFGLAATQMAEGTKDKPSPLAPFVKCFESEIQLAEGGGTIYRVAAVAGTNDGGLPTAGFADEIHEWTGKKERVHLVLFQGLDKRFNGIVVNITTPDDADPTSLLGKKVAYAERLAAGELEDPGFYYLRYSAPDDCKLETPEQVIAAVDSAHPAEWVDPAKIARKLLVDKIPVHEFRRYWLGQFVRGGGQWLPEDAWESRWVESDPPDDRTECVLAFVGNHRRTVAAIVGCTLTGHIFTVKAWEAPPGADETWKVPRGEVRLTMAAEMDRLEVLEMAPDPPGWIDEVEAWEETYGETVVRFNAKEPALMSQACTRFYAAVAPEQAAQDGGETEQPDLPITHDGNPVVTRHLINAVVKKTTSGELITKESPDSPRQIAAAVGAVAAYERACWRFRNLTAAPTAAYSASSDPRAGDEMFRPSGRLTI